MFSEPIVVYDCMAYAYIGVYNGGAPTLWTQQPPEFLAAVSFAGIVLVKRHTMHHQSEGIGCHKLAFLLYSAHNDATSDYMLQQKFSDTRK